mgnify:FL=1|jgi:hypothetical protein|tara:strand:- start:1945 stop:2469 length:525 start_codon:yes stop_codon:yes gene_type:complete
MNILDRKYFFFITLVIIYLACATISNATSHGEPEVQSRFGDWRVLKYVDDSREHCYIASSPIKQAPTDKEWNPNFFIKKIDGGSHNEPSLYAGYNFKKDTPVTIKILNSTFSMSAKDKHAWLITKDEENKLVEAMKKGYQMIIKGTSEFETSTTDHYSLKGVTRSLQELNDICL